MSENRQPFYARCPACHHVWPAAWLPMPLAMAAKLLGRAACPNCGSDKDILAASRTDIDGLPSALDHGAPALTINEHAHGDDRP